MKRPLDYTTNDTSFVQVEMKYDFWSDAQYVNPFVKLLQQLQCSVCTLIGLKILYSIDLLESTHLPAYAFGNFQVIP